MSVCVCSWGLERELIYIVISGILAMSLNETSDSPYTIHRGLFPLIVFVPVK